MAIEKFLKLHPPSYDSQRGLKKCPVVVANMPAAPSERRFFAKLLESLHAPFAPTANLMTLETIAMRVLRQDITFHLCQY